MLTRHEKPTVLYFLGLHGEHTKSINYSLLPPPYEVHTQTFESSRNGTIR